MLKAISSRRVLPFIVGVAITSSVLNIWLLCSLVPARILPLEALRNARNRNRVYGPHDSTAEQERLLRLLRKHEIFVTERKSIEQVLAMQQLVGNQVVHVGPFWGRGRESACSLMDTAKQGTGLSCGQMSRILRESLTVMGYEARLVQLFLSDFQPLESHVVVEVLLNGRWIVLDPTFNLTFRRGNRLLGVGRIRSLLAVEGPESVEVLYHGDREYPARLEKYYMDWRPLFSNALVVAPAHIHGFWRRLPPIRWWQGPCYYYFGDGAFWFAAAHNRVYFLACAILPIGNAGLWTAIAGFRVRRRHL